MRKSDISSLMRERLPASLLEMFHQIGQVAEELEVAIFVVGGFVRDLLLERENLDVDIVVEGDGIAFAEAFARRHGCRVRAHRKFGTAVIIFPDDFKVDVASTRMEYYLEPAALPTVEHASIKLDLYRRDFTINTLAVALHDSQFGELLDFFGGQRDLKDKVLRVLHNLSFVEDPTRVFRAVRFEARLGLSIGKQTEHLVRNAVRMGFLDRIAGPRLFNELKIILKQPRPFAAVRRMAELDLLRYLHPALDLDEQSEELFAQADRALHWHGLTFPETPCRRWVVYLLCLTGELDGDAMAGLCQRHGVPPRYRELFCEQRPRAHRALFRLQRPEQRQAPPSVIYHLLEDFAIEVLLYMIARAPGEEIRGTITRYCTTLRRFSPPLSGKDLQKLGVPPGPRYKEILRTLLDARLDGEITTRREAEALVRSRFLGGRSGGNHRPPR